MKKTIIYLISFFLFFVACKKEKCNDGCYSWSGGGYIKYKATIGYNFESAFDSLISMKYLNCTYNDKPHYIESEQMDGVNYPYDNRTFYMIKVIDSTTGYILASPVDALDTKGCWYTIIWYED